MATLYKRGTAYYLNWREDGQQFRRSLGSIGRKAAEAVRAEKEAELLGIIAPKAGITMGGLLDDYLTWYETARPTTYKRAKSTLKRIRERFGAFPAEAVSPAAIEKWASADRAPGVTEKALKLSRAAYRRALRLQQIRSSPFDRVQIQKSVVSRAPDYYRPQQLEELAKAAHGPLWVFMANTGIRRGEMVKALRDDVRDGHLMIESSASGRTKSRKWRPVPLNSAALDALGALGDDQLVDCHPDTLGDWFRAEARALGLRGSLHWLRHTFCTALAQSGVSLYEIQHLAGHSSTQVTEQYAHHCPTSGQPAVDRMAAWMVPQAQKKHSG